MKIKVVICLAVALLLPGICSAEGSAQKLASIIDTLIETRDFSANEVDRLFNQTLLAMSDGANSDALIGGVPEKLLAARLSSKIAGILVHRFTEHSKGRDILTNVSSIYSTIDNENAEIMEDIIGRKLAFLQNIGDGNSIETGLADPMRNLGPISDSPVPNSTFNPALSDASGPIGGYGGASTIEGGKDGFGGAHSVADIPPSMMYPSILTFDIISVDKPLE